MLRGGGGGGGRKLCGQIHERVRAVWRERERCVVRCMTERVSGERERERERELCGQIHEISSEGCVCGGGGGRYGQIH